MLIGANSPTVDTFTGVISDGVTSGNVGIVRKLGSGTQNLGGINTYTGYFTNEAGVCTVLPGGQLCDPSAQVIMTAARSISATPPRRSSASPALGAPSTWPQAIL